MKKITFKIKSGTKRLILGLSVLAAIGFGAYVSPAATAKSSLAVLMPFGLVESMKKKGATFTEDEEKEYKALETGINDCLAKAFDGVITTEKLNEEIGKIKSGMTDEQTTKFNDALETIAKQSQAIDMLKTAGNPGGGTTKSLRDQIKEQLTTAEAKAALDKMRSKQAGAPGLQFDVKAAGTMQISTSTAYTTAGTAIAFPQPEFIPGLNNVARNQPFLMQLLNVMPTGKANIVYTEKYNPDGAAGWVGEGVAASEVDFDVRIGESRAKMVDAYIKVSTQMLDDIDYMASEIEKELIYQIAIKIDTDLLQGDGTGDNLAGISSFVGGYTLTTLSTTLPNNFDAILAAATQISTDNFRPDIAIMNTVDYNQTKLLKGSTGYYLVNPNNKDNNWGGVMVVPSNQVPVGYTLVMDSSKTNVYRYQDFSLSYGWVNDDFTKNLVTIMASQRLHSFIKNNDVNAFVYDTLANIKAAITAV